jgi:hypothetical protein
VNSFGRHRFASWAVSLSAFLTIIGHLTNAQMSAPAKSGRQDIRDFDRACFRWLELAQTAS